jgi:hypothetical protein
MWWKMYIVLCVKKQLLLSDCNVTSILLTNFRKILKYLIQSNSFQHSPVVPYGRTDMTMVTAGLENFANAPKNSSPVSNVTPTMRPAALNAMTGFRRNAAAACWESRTANGALRHTGDTLCVGVLHFQNVTECHCACHYNRMWHGVTVQLITTQCDTVSLC